MITKIESYHVLNIMKLYNYQKLYNIFEDHEQNNVHYLRLEIFSGCPFMRLSNFCRDVND